MLNEWPVHTLNYKPQSHSNVTFTEEHRRRHIYHFYSNEVRRRLVYL